MTTTPHDATSLEPTTIEPNHHAHFPGFAGASGLLAALTFAVGRDEDSELAQRLTGLHPDDDLVDIGCGPGVAVRRARAAGIRSAVGIDPAPVMLRVARLLTRRDARGATRRYLEGSAESLPLADDSASVVWSIATVHHWGDLDAGLAEVRRVLRSGGRFLAMERHTEAGAHGLASHGWTDEQAAAFAVRCEEAGFTSTEIGHHETRRRPVLSVLVRP
jgi:ubiquinone/menaquinone biosynthesis C-methylase UbiE